MGKRYYCDYCDKSMVASPSMVKTHNKGLAHQKIVQEHYAQYKDPETILAEESGKRPCTRFVRGECSFGSVCHFSHYSREQLEALRQYVSTKNKEKQLHINPSHSFEDLYQKLQDEKSSKTQESNHQTVVCDKNGVTHVLPWTYNPVFNTFGDSLPPSLRKMTVEDFETADVAYISHDATASPGGVPDDLVNSVIRIINNHEQYLKSKSDISKNITIESKLSILKEYNSKIKDDFGKSHANADSKDTANATHNCQRTNAYNKNKRRQKTNEDFATEAVKMKKYVSKDFFRPNVKNIVRSGVEFLSNNASVHNMQDSTNSADEELKSNMSSVTPFVPRETEEQDVEHLFIKVSEQTGKELDTAETTSSKKVKKSRKHTTTWPTSNWPARYFVDMAHLIYANRDTRRQYKPTIEHQRKIDELTTYMKSHFVSTNYFYKEMERIKKQREVVDELRKMVDYLEQPGRASLKAKALKCFNTEIVDRHVTRDFWKDRKPNNLNINVLRDPINDGLIP